MKTNIRFNLTLYSNTRIDITKFIFIEEKIEIKTKYLFSLLISVYQTWLCKNDMKLIIN